MAKQQYWKVGEIANLYRIHPNVVYEWIHRGDLPAMRFGKGGSFRVSQKDLELFERRSRF